MEPQLMVSPRNLATPNAEFFPTGYKRVKVSCNSKDYGSTTFSTTTSKGSQRNKEKVSPNVIDYSDPFAVSNMLETFTGGKYGSVTKEIEDLISRRAKMVNPFFERHPFLSNILTDGRNKPVKEVPSSTEQQFIRVTDVIDLEDDSVASDLKKTTEPVIIPDSDDEETTPKQMFEEVVLGKPTGLVPVKDVVLRDFSNKRLYKEEMVAPPKASKEAEIEKTDTDSRDVDIEKSKGVYLGVEDDADDDDTEAGDDGLGELWKDLSVSLVCDKDVPESHSSDEHMEEDDDCEHSFVLKDDIGYVCRICGVIQRGIETIIDYQYNKVKRSTRTSAYEPRNAKDRESIETGVKLSENELMVTEISAHPRHTKQMKPHQVEGFNFLCSNLVIDNPGGCILAHAPGSGKTFMIISFIQSFLAKYPQAKPLVVLPKGILPTWKREFQTWQVEDIPLYDFYSVKADNRLQQLEVLKKWVEQKSILFLGYKQFSTIICDSGESNTAIACQEILLKAPSILILDEGHTPRNEETDVLQSLAKVQTPRKVVLSGTLYQNHVKEVFNILNLVRPKFLRTDTSKALMKRIMSKVKISGVRKRAGGEAAFYDLVENTLQDDENFERKASVIHDLREMTSKVLHYYKGDFLDELPGLVDFTVVLNLTPKQKMAQKSLTKFRRKFKIASVGSAVYLHPKLNTTENSVMTDGVMDELLNSISIQDGVKAKFFLNMLNLCESAGEKLLVFSQYLNPLKFLERLAVKDKCWLPGREVFQITGESSSEHREWSMERFNNAPEAKVLFGSIRACGEGISLVGASRIIILDVPLNPSVTRQAIGRAFRPGQKKKVYAYRLIAAESPEEEDHETCFQKELIAKMWFEWNQCYGFRDFQVEKIDLNECDDPFLEKPSLREDVKGLYRR